MVVHKQYRGLEGHGVPTRPTCKSGSIKPARAPRTGGAGALNRLCVACVTSQPRNSSPPVARAGKDHDAPPRLPIIFCRVQTNPVRSDWLRAAKIDIHTHQSPDEEMKKIVLKVVKQCVGTDGVDAAYVKEEILPEYFRAFWVRRMALDRRNHKQVRLLLSLLLCWCWCWCWTDQMDSRSWLRSKKGRANSRSLSLRCKV